MKANRASPHKANLKYEELDLESCHTSSTEVWYEEKSLKPANQPGILEKLDQIDQHYSSYIHCTELRHIEYVLAFLSFSHNRLYAMVFIFFNVVLHLTYHFDILNLPRTHKKWDGNYIEPFFCVGIFIASQSLLVLLSSQIFKYTIKR